MAAEVSAINGGRIAVPGEPSENLVQCLEDLLARARAGEITGIAGAYTTATGRGWVQSSASFEAGHAYGFSLIGALETIKQRVVMGCLEGE